MVDQWKIHQILTMIRKIVVDIDQRSISTTIFLIIVNHLIQLLFPSKKKNILKRKSPFDDSSIRHCRLYC